MSDPTTPGLRGRRILEVRAGLDPAAGERDDSGRGAVMDSVAIEQGVRATATEHLEGEARRFTRRVRTTMAVEGALALALGGVGVAAVLGAQAVTATVVGVRLGLPQFAVLAAVGAAILVTLRHPAWLRRVAVSKAVVASAMFVAGSVYYPHGVWDINVAGIFVPVVISLAGFVEFVFLGSVNFVSAPSDVPYRDAAEGHDQRARETPRGTHEGIAAAGR